MKEQLAIRDLRVGNEKATMLNGVTMSLQAGRSMGLVGPSGSGKTILARSILGVLPEQVRYLSGEIKLNEMDLVCCTEHERRRIRGKRIAYMVQNPSSALDPTTTIRSQIGITLSAHGMDPARHAVWKEVRYWFTRVGFRDPDEVMGLYPFQLSGGMARRVYLAMLFLLEPGFLIVDEPTSGLDVTTSRSIMQILFGMQQRCTIMIITHDVRLLAGQIDRIAVMYQGRIVEEGAMDKLVQNPQNDITEQLLRPLQMEKLM